MSEESIFELVEKKYREHNSNPNFNMISLPKSIIFLSLISERETNLEDVIEGIKRYNIEEVPPISSTYLFIFNRKDELLSLFLELGLIKKQTLLYPQYKEYNRYINKLIKKMELSKEL